VLLAAGAIETARLLLNSPSAREPAGLGNNADQVGRHLQGHVYAGAFAVLDEPAQDCLGPGPSIATNDFRHHNPGILGGGMLANDFVMPPLLAWGVLAAQRAGPTWGAANKRAMREHYRRLVSVTGPVQEVPTPDARVTVDRDVRDRLGIPVARLGGRVHAEDRRTGTSWPPAPPSGSRPAERTGSCRSSGFRRAPAAASTRRVRAGWAPTRPGRSPTRGAASGATTTCTSWTGRCTSRTAG
jgi:choline dehydrogenase-like flavoprotein